MTDFKPTPDEVRMLAKAIAHENQAGNRVIAAQARWQQAKDQKRAAIMACCRRMREEKKYAERSTQDYETRFQVSAWIDRITPEIACKLLDWSTKRSARYQSKK